MSPKSFSCQRSKRLIDPQQTLGERPFGIDPLKVAPESGAFGQRTDLLRKELIAALRPDCFAGLQLNGKIPIDVHRLLRFRPQMHFNALLALVVARLVLKVVQLERSAQYTIDASKQVQVECGGQSQRVIICSKHLLDRLDEVGAQKKNIGRLKRSAHSS